MPKRIKNWDKLNNKTFLYDDVMYKLETHNPIESEDSNVYPLLVKYDKFKVAISASIIINKREVTSLSLNHKWIEDEYRLVVKIPVSPKTQMEVPIFKEVINDYHNFCNQLELHLKQMLKTIKESKVWQTQNGYTI